MKRSFSGMRIAGIKPTVIHGERGFFEHSYNCDLTIHQERSSEICIN